jgi:hypothetical protein
MTSDWYRLIIAIGMLLSGVYFFVVELKYKNQHRIIFAILVLVTCLEFYAGYLAGLKVNNSLYYNLFFIYLETILFLLFFRINFESRKAKTNYIPMILNKRVAV